MTQPLTTEPLLSPREAADLIRDRGARLLDVREPDEFQREHLAGAVSLPLSQIGQWLEGEVSGGDSTKRIIVYCQSGARSAQAARQLQEAGATVTQINGGIQAWKRAEFPVVRGTGTTIGIMRQVQITIGALNLIGFALAWQIDPWFLAIPVFTSAGLLFAGLSGTCGMAFMLAKMPWNNSASKTCTKGGGCS